MDITDVDVLRQFEAEVPGPNGANRFIIMVGLMRIPLRDQHGHETYRCLVGPELQPHDVLGVSYLPSIDGRC